MTLYTGWTRTAVARKTATAYGYQTSTARTNQTATANAVGTAGVKTMTALPPTQTAMAATLTALATYLPTPTPTTTMTLTVTATPTATLTPGPIAFSVGSTAPYGLRSMNFDGSNLQTMLGDGLVCDWVPGGMKLIIEKGSPSQLYSINRDGSNPVTLSNQPPGDDNSQAAVSPDGQWIVFSSGSMGSRQLYLLQMVDPFNLTLLTMPGENYAPDWTPASMGNKIVFVSTAGGTADIYTLDLGLTLPPVGPYSPSSLPGNTTSEEDTPHYSPDGANLAYARYDGSKWEVCASNATDLSASICTTSSTLYTVRPEPEISADGLRIIFISDYVTTANIWTVNFDGSGFSEITYSNDPLRRPNWAP